MLDAKDDEARKVDCGQYRDRSHYPWFSSLANFSGMDSKGSFRIAHYWLQYSLGFGQYAEAIYLLAAKI